MNLGRWIGLIALFGCAYVLWQIREILLLVFVAIVLAIALNQVVLWFQRLGMKRHWAIALSVLGFLGVTLGFVALLVPPAIEQLQNIVALLPEVVQRVERGVNWLEQRLPAIWLDDAASLNLLTQQIQGFTTQVLSDFFIWISDLLAIVFKSVLAIVLMVMFLTSPRQYRQPFILLFPAFYRSRVDEILDRCQTDLVGWIHVTLITMLLFGGVSGLGLTILGLPFVLANSLWAALSQLVPNVGYILAMLPPLAIALLEQPWKALPVILLYFLIQQVESYVVMPWMMSRSVDLPPAFTLLAQVIFAVFFGALGLFLALPLMLMTKVWLQELFVKDVMDRWERRST